MERGDLKSLNGGKKKIKKLKKNHLKSHGHQHQRRRRQRQQALAQTPVFLLVNGIGKKNNNNKKEQARQ